MTSFLIKGVRIFDGESTIGNGSVLVENGKIAKVSSSEIPYEGKTIAKPGHTLLPGLIDVHIHADGGNTIALPQSLGFGVTTVCDMHNEIENIEKVKKQLETEGDAVCSDLKTTQVGATVDNGWPMPVVLAHDKSEAVLAEVATWPKLVTPEDGRMYIRDRVRDGADYIKLFHESGTFMGAKFNVPSIELQEAIIEEAHKHGLKTVAHSTCLADQLAILEAGVDGLTHMFVDQPPNEQIIAAYKKNNAHCNPTLVCMGSCTGDGKAMQEKYAHDPRVQHLISEERRDAACQCMAFCTEDCTPENAYEAVRQLKKAGIDILCGSDAARPALGCAYGLSMHQELALFVQTCGFTPAEALRSATFLPARRFGFNDRGSIKEGLKADLVLVEGNPLEDIDNTLNLRGVWKNGVLCHKYEGSL